MRISHKHRFVFLAMPKTASTTIRRVLDKYSDIKSRPFLDTSDEFPFYHHISAPVLKKIFEKRGWDWYDYKRFCIVRNPYDRLVSLYHHRLKMIEKKIKKKGIIVNLFGKVKNLVMPLTFKEYVNNIPKNKMASSLKPFICDESGNFLVEDILMYENIHDKFPNYMKSLGIHITTDDIPHLNPTKNRVNYKNYYNEDTKNIISDLYTYEISRFDYRF